MRILNVCELNCMECSCCQTFSLSVGDLGYTGPYHNPEPDTASNLISM